MGWGSHRVHRRGKIEMAEDLLQEQRCDRSLRIDRLFAWAGHWIMVTECRRTFRYDTRTHDIEEVSLGLDSGQTKRCRGLA